MDGVVIPKKRGRPKGSKNKVKTDSVTGEIIPSQPQVLTLYYVFLTAGLGAVTVQGVFEIIISELYHKHLCMDHIHR